MQSEILIMNSTQTKVRRKYRLKFNKISKSKVDARTIYIEGL